MLQEPSAEAMGSGAAHCPPAEVGQPLGDGVDEESLKSSAGCTSVVGAALAVLLMVCKFFESNTPVSV